MVSFDDPDYHDEVYAALDPTQRLTRLQSDRTKLRELITRKHTAIAKRFTYASASSLEVSDAIDLLKRMSVSLSSFDDAIQEQDPGDANLPNDYYSKLDESQRRLDDDADRAHKRETVELDHASAQMRHSIVQQQAPSPTPSASGSVRSNSPPSFRLKTAKCELPSFDGIASHYRKWIRMYEELVEDNDTYPPAAKFLVFIDKIGAKGKNLVGNLEPTAEGLQEAKLLMSEFYGDEQRIREDVCERVRQLKPFTMTLSNDALRESIAILEQSLDSLEAANSGSVYIDGTFFDLMMTKLTDLMAVEYQESHLNRSERTAATLIQFIKRKSKAFIAAKDAKSRSSGPTATPHVSHQRNRPSGVATVTNPVHASAPAPRPVSGPSNSAPRPLTCAICGGQHRNIFCRSHDAKTRRQLAERARLCLRCLKAHDPGQCNSSYLCSNCKQPHSRVVCETVPSAPPLPPTNPSPAASQQIINTNLPVYPQHPAFAGNTFAVLPLCSSLSVDPSHVSSYVPTVIVNIQGIRTRALLDTGASKSLISASLARKLECSRAEQKLPLRGIFSSGAASTSQVRMSVDLTSLDGSFSLNTVLSVVPNFEPLYLAPVPSQERDRLKLKGVYLAEGDEPVEIILGPLYVNQLWLTQEIPVGEGTTARLSKFGWTFSGDLYSHSNDTLEYVNVVNTVYQAMHRPPITLPDPDKKLEDEYLDEFIQRNVHYKENQYSVNLPWIDGDPVPLSHNRKLALKRLERQQHSLRTRGLTEQYQTALNEMTTNFAEPAPEVPTGPVYYLPHHCVIRKDKSTTQTRIVFDGSAHEPDKRSINDKLYKGIVGWDSLSLLIQFRLGAVAVTADIEKAFLMIGVEPTDRDALRFLKYDAGKVTDWRFTVVPFGLSSSPAVLYATLQAHLKRFASEYPDVVSTIRNRMYVDDLVLTFQSVQPDQIDRFKERTVELLARGKMNMRKWRTNIPELDAKWSPDAKEHAKILGHLWAVQADTISLAIDADSCIKPRQFITKRIFTSITSSVYDPIGLVSPFHTTLRLFTRELWSHELDWDTPLPDELHQRAARLIAEVAQVNKVTVPRNALPPDGSSPRLVVYCDASKNALGVVVYCVTDSHSQLLYSKAKLARETTIPTLELDALVLAAETARYLRTLYPFKVVIVYSDSLLNLQRMVQHPNDQKPSITLRVVKIKRLTDATYRHVKTKENHADVVSRGCSLTELLANKSWWSGPEPSSQTLFDNPAPINFVGALLAEPANPVCGCPSFPDYAALLQHYAQQVDGPSSDDLMSTQEQALLLMIKAVQSLHFPTELESLQSAESVRTPLPSTRRYSSRQLDLERAKSKRIDRGSVLRNYTCFLDSNGIIRIRTRLSTGAWLTQDQVCPILLPTHCRTSRLIVTHEHERNLHGGVDRIIGSVRERYFIIGLRRLSKSISFHCEYCRLKRAVTFQTSLGVVPSFRYDINSAPFAHTGIDIFGPLSFIHLKSPGKRYGLIFTCATTRAVHLEIINDITHDTVFKAMRLFIAARGVPRLIYTDNGTQLVAIQKRLIDMLNSLARDHPEREIRTIDWQTITPAAPWRGGFYERLIRIVKDSLKPLTFGKKSVDDLELYVAIKEVEAYINSRPLFSYDGEVVTPAQFYTGKPPTLLPAIGNAAARTLNRDTIVDTYIKTQRHVNACKAKFRDGYLVQLKQFHQNPASPNSGNQLQVGDTVFLKRDTPMDSWPKGTVVSIHTSPDGIVRSATVCIREKNKEILKKEDVKRLIPLECGFERPTNSTSDTIQHPGLDLSETSSNPDLSPTSDSHSPDLNISQATQSPPEDVTESIRPQDGAPEPSARPQRASRRIAARRQ